MANEKSLGMRLYTDALLTEVARTVGYVGFPARELATRLGELARRFGAHRLAAALVEIATFAGNRVMLKPLPRKLCWGLLGPPPERWSEWYTHPDGTPRERPPGREKPPEIPPGGSDTLMEGLARLTHGELQARLVTARKAAQGPKGARTEATAVASEMLRRGMDLPPEEPGIPAAKPKRQRRKKAN
jgi:hypothetical protein